MSFVVVSFYTPKYTECVKRLKRSLKKFGIPHDIEKIKSNGEWIVNANRKATFIKCKFSIYNEPVVWVDADAVIRKYPDYFDVIEEDIRYWVLGIG